jgi:hypothetical protein
MEDLYEYFKRTLAEDREKRRAEEKEKRRMRYLIRTTARRGYENIRRSIIPLSMYIAAFAAMIVSLKSPGSITGRLALLAYSVLMGLALVFQGVLCRKQSSEWMEVGGVLQKRPFAKWPCNMIIAFGVLLLCLGAFLEVIRLLRSSSFD